MEYIHKHFYGGWFAWRMVVHKTSCIQLQGRLGVGLGTATGNNVILLFGRVLQIQSRTLDKLLPLKYIHVFSCKKLGSGDRSESFLKMITF